MKRNNIVKGIICLAAAVLIILIASGVLNVSIFAGISTGKLIATVILGIVFVGAIISLSFEGIIIFGGILLKMYDRQLGFTISIPVLIIVMILLIMAVNFLIPKEHRHHMSKHGKYSPDFGHQDEDGNGYFIEENEEDGSHIYSKSRFNGVCKYITSPNFKEAVIDSRFGGVELYLNDAKVPSGSALIYLETQFSGVEIYIPKNWRVVPDLHCSMGDYSEDPIVLEEGEDAPVILNLSGKTEFGGVKVNRI